MQFSRTAGRISFAYACKLTGGTANGLIKNQRPAEGAWADAQVRPDSPGIWGGRAAGLPVHCACRQAGSVHARLDQVRWHHRLLTFPWVGAFTQGKVHTRTHTHIHRALFYRGRLTSLSHWGRWLHSVYLPYFYYQKPFFSHHRQCWSDVLELKTDPRRKIKRHNWPNAEEETFHRWIS